MKTRSPPCVLRRRVPEVVEADLVERRRRLVAGDVPAELRRLLVRLQHRRHRVPADELADLALDRLSPGYGGSALRRDRVDVRRGGPPAAARRRRARACSTIRSTRKRARSAPSCATTESSESSHSRVSSASMSAVAFPLLSSVVMCSSTSTGAQAHGSRTRQPAAVRRPHGRETLHVHAAVDGEHLPGDVATTRPRRGTAPCGRSPRPAEAPSGSAP